MMPNGKDGAMAQLSEANLGGWLDANVLMDAKRQPSPLPSEEISPSLDGLRHYPRQHEQAYAELRRSSVAFRLRLLAEKASDAGLGPAPVPLRLVEQARVIPVSELEGDCEEISYVNVRSRRNSYDWDSYELKLAVLREWGKCCVFVGHRSNMRIAAGLRGIGLIPEDCPFIVVVNPCSKDVYELVDEGLEDGSINADLDANRPGAARLVYYDMAASYEEDISGHRRLPAAKLESHVFYTCEWDRVNGLPFMLKVHPYEGMPGKLAELFEKSLCLDFVRMAAMSLTPFTSHHYLHTWDIPEFADTVRAMALGFADDDPDLAALVEECGPGSGFDCAYLDYEPGQPEHAGVTCPAGMKKRYEALAERVRGLALAWNGADRCVRDTIRDIRDGISDETLSDCLRHHAQPQTRDAIECFWLHGVPVDDVFA